MCHKNHSLMEMDKMIMKTYKRYIKGVSKQKNNPND